METKYRNKLWIPIILLMNSITCVGQEYSKKQLDSLYSERFHLYNNLNSSDIKINGLYAINEDQKLLENVENMFGKADYYEEFGPFPDEGIEEVSYCYYYGCNDFENCNKRYQSINLKTDIICFYSYPPNQSKKMMGEWSIEMNKYKGKEFFITIKGKKNAVGDKSDDLKSLLPNSYKYYKLLSDNDYPVGLICMIFSENKKVYFGLDENDRIKNIEIESIE